MQNQKENFNKKILVIGDIILDRYVFGEAERISDEAPVPIVKVFEERFLPGGAGNVSANIISLGGKVTLLGAIGNDEVGILLKKELKKRKISFFPVIQPATTQKIRILARGQQLVRVDYEKNNSASSRQVVKSLKKFLSEKGKNFDVFVISDYSKGVITREIAHLAISLARKNKKPVIVDTKPNHVNFFQGATILTPNHKEACAMSGESDVLRAGRVLQDRLRANILVTQGKDGMTLFEGKGVFHLKTEAKEVFDVTGAGDTVVAALAVFIASGHSLVDAAALANRAAGVVVGKIGTATVSLAEIKEINSIK